jgi:hypothetical protein
MKRFIIFFGLVATVTMTSFVADAQTRVGTIQGTVKDPNGALVPSATVTISQPVTGYKQTVKTDEQGNYRVVNVPFNT